MVQKLVNIPLFLLIYFYIYFITYLRERLFIEQKKKHHWDNKVFPI